MKTDDEMLQSILSRFDEYQEQKKKRLLARKFRLKKLCSGLALAAATVCGCMTFCFGGYAMWNYVVKPIVTEEKQPEHPVATQTVLVTQTEKSTETSVTTVTTVSTTQAETETTTKVTTTTEPVTEVYEEEEYTEPSKEINLSKGYIQYRDLRQNCKKINEYIEQNDVDAECYMNYHSDSQKDKPLLLLYINDKGKEDAECYIKENNIDINKVKIEEMELDLKASIIESRIHRFIVSNDLSCYGGGLEINENDNNNIVFVGECVYKANRKEDIETLKEYITYHGYDNILPFAYEIKASAEVKTEGTEADKETVREEDE